MPELRKQHGLQLINYFKDTLDGTFKIGPLREKSGLSFCVRFSISKHTLDACFVSCIMTISFSYNKKQVIQALRYHFLSRPEIRILLILVNVFAIGSAILLYFRIIQPLSFLMFSILWFLLMLVIWRILPQSIYKRSRTFQDHFSMEFDEEHVVLRTDKGQKAWPYKVFTKYVESPYFFHLYFDPRSFFLVPTDAFKDLEERQAARHLLKSKIK